MKTFILLTKLSPELTVNIQSRSLQGQSWMHEVKSQCPDVKFIGHYALLGQYDFMDIYEAPDEMTAAKVSLISREFGAVEAQSLTAIPYKDYLEIIKSLYPKE
jgi:uncharacterized protein with GYD domain